MRLTDVQSDGLTDALGRVLSPVGSGRPADRSHVRSFTDYLSACRIPWRAMRCDRGGAPTGVAFALLLPGRTAMLLIPPLHGGLVRADDQQAATGALLDALSDLNLHYAQALLDPLDEPRRAMLQAAGFWRLAGLHYLERNPIYPWCDPPAAAEAQWIAYDERDQPPAAPVHRRFAETIQATYRESADCPALTDLRPVDDVMAGHKATGRFDPALWQLALVDGQAAGCLLLARLTHGPVFEVAYMGVHPDFRRRGVGGLLLRRALDLSRQRAAQRLTLVVDEQNAPARRLYDRFAFSLVARREAWLMQWKAKTAVAPLAVPPSAESRKRTAAVDNPLR